MKERKLKTKIWYDGHGKKPFKWEIREFREAEYASTPGWYLASWPSPNGFFDLAEGMAKDAQAAIIAVGHVYAEILRHDAVKYLQSKIKQDFAVVDEEL